MRNILLALLMMVALISCQKEESNPVGNNGNQSQNGNSEAENSYYPTSKGSWWKYSGILQGKFLSQVITCSDEKLIDGSYYATMTAVGSNGATSISYIRVQNHEYFNIGLKQNEIAKKENEVCILKEDKPVGEKWTTPPVLVGTTPNRYVNEILETNGTYVIKGKTFQNVLVLKIIDEVEMIPGSDDWFPMLTSRAYFSKGIGLIKADYGVLGSQEIEDYSIK
ncbi:MAG: hypothetical protein RO257_09165 [Candidatus Kapabacteria bacterium]|nr:hypothetical protein [Candidatus Kapabacteria bacterium]